MHRKVRRLRNHLLEEMSKEAVMYELEVTEANLQEEKSKNTEDLIPVSL